MTKTVSLSEPCRAQLFALYAAQQQAERLYNTTTNAVLAALGIDPATLANVNLDTGVITLKAPTKAESPAA